MRSTPRFARRRCPARHKGSQWGWAAFFLLLAGCQDARPPWRPATPSPIPRFEAAVARVGSEIFFFGGFKAPGENYSLLASNRVDAFSPEEGVWTRKRDMPSAVTHLNAIFDGEEVWFAGGFVGDHPGPATDAVWRYHVATDAWSRGLPLPEPRAGGGLVLLERELHYVGGFGADRDTTHAGHWVLSLDDPGAGWLPRAPLVTPRGHLGVIAFHGKIYAIGGQLRHDSDPIDVRALEVYEPKNDTWAIRAALPEGRSHFEASTVVLGAGVAIAGGRANQSGDPERHDATDDILLYDPQADRWTTLAQLPAPLLGTAAFSMGSQLFIATGAREAWNNPTDKTYVTPLEALGLPRKP